VRLAMAIFVIVLALATLFYRTEGHHALAGVI
jgi:hypothetical protein